MTEPNTTGSLEGANDTPMNDQVDLGVVNSTLEPTVPAVASAPKPPPVQPKKGVSRLKITAITILSVIILGAIGYAVLQRTQRMSPAQDKAYNAQHIDLESLELSDTANEQPSTLTVNGQLAISGSLQVAPGTKPVNPQMGQIYFDKDTQQLGFYNGSDFVYLQGGSLVEGDTIYTTNVTNVNVAGAVTNISDVTNVTNITNNYSTETPPAILLQGDTPGTVQTGNFAIDGTGALNIADIGTGNITTAVIDAATINTTTVTTATINTATVTNGNITLVNTAQVNSEGQAFTVNKFAEVPSGVPVTIGQTTIGPSSLNTGFSTVATKLITGGSGGPLQSLSMYIVRSPVVYSLYGNWPLAAPIELPLIVSFYADDGSYPDRPGELLWTQTIDDVDITDNAWLTIDTENTPLQPSTPYWVSVRLPYNNNAPFYQLGANFSLGKVTKTTANNTCSTGEGWTGTATDPFSSTPCTLSSEMLNIYMNYITDPSTGGAGAMFSLTDKGQAAFRNTEDSLNAFKIQDAASGSTVFNVDTFYRRVAIGKATADYKLDINGDLNLSSSSPLRFGGTAALVGNSTTTTLMGTNIYVQGDVFTVQNAAGTSNYLSVNGTNGATTLAGATTFNSTTTHTGPATFGSTMAVAGATTLSGTATLNGATTVNNTLTNKVNSTTAFRVQNAASSTLFNVDTTNNDITVGSGSSTFAINRDDTPPPPAGTNVDIGTTTSLLSSNTSYRTGTSQLAIKVTTGPGGGTLQSLSAYVLANSGYTFYLGLYTDDGNFPNSRPDALLAQTAATTSVASQWNTAPVLAPVTLDPYTSYWIAIGLPPNIVIPQGSGGPSHTICSGPALFSAPTMGAHWSDKNSYCAGYGTSDLSLYATYLTDPADSSAGNAMFSLSNTGQALFRATEDSTRAFRVQDATNGATLFNINSVTGNLSIGKKDANYKLDIAGGDINLSNGTSLRFGGSAAVYGNSTSTVVTGGTVNVQSANFRVQSADGGTNYLTITSGVATFAGATTFSSTTAHTGAATFSSTATLNGATSINNTLTNKVTSASAFKIQNGSSVDLFVADTTNRIITVKGADTTFASLTVTDAHIKLTQTTAPTISTPTNCGTTPTATVAAGSTDTAGTFTITTGTDGTSSTCDTTLTFRTTYGTAPKSIIVSPRSAIASQRGIYAAPATTTDFAVGFANSAGGTDNTAYTFSYWVIE